MDCRRAERILQDYLDGSLGGDLSRSVQRHIQACPACSGEAVRYRKLYSLLTEVPPAEVPAGFAERVLARLKAARVLPAPGLVLPKRVVYALVSVLVAAACLLPVVAVSQGFRERLAHAVVWFSGLLIDAKAYLAEFGFFYKLFLVLEKDLRGVRTLGRVIGSLIFRPEFAVVLFALGLILTILVGLLFKSVQKRSVRNAPLCL